MCTDVYTSWRDFFSFGDFSISLYFLVHSVPYKENMVLSCAQISIGLDSLEDSVFNYYFLKLDFSTCCEDRGSVGFVSFSLVLVLFFLTLIHLGRFSFTLLNYHSCPLLSCPSASLLHACYTPMVP